MTKITLTEKQQKGLDIAVKRFHDKETHTTIAGYAGTGKTFLVKEIIKALGLSPKEFLMATYTGKAALRLQQTGFPEARTLHKILYTSTPIVKDKVVVGFHHKPIKKEEFIEGGVIKLVIVDEVSMVPDGILHQLASLGVHVIMLGDPGQLPPIGASNGILDSPDIFLDEIQRQAEGSPIIRLSKAIREGEKINPSDFDGDIIKIVRRKDVIPAMYTWADQVICGKNATRQMVNNEVRNTLGHTSPVPEEGEKIIITRNNWDFINEDGYSLVNGLIANVDRSYTRKDPRAELMGEQCELGFLQISTEFTPSPFTGVRYDALEMKTGKKSYNMDVNSKDAYKKINSLDFGYAITGHKSQGSEFGKLLAFEEVLNQSQHRRWLYTVVTRAVDKLVLVIDETSGVWTNQKK